MQTHPTAPPPQRSARSTSDAPPHTAPALPNLAATIGTPKGTAREHHTGRYYSQVAICAIDARINDDTTWKVVVRVARTFAVVTFDTAWPSLALSPPNTSDSTQTLQLVSNMRSQHSTKKGTHTAAGAKPSRNFLSLSWSKVTPAPPNP